MDVWAIIPVKSLARSKGRLAHLLSVEEREQLMRTMLNNVLAVVKEVPGIAQTIVVSSDPTVWQIAEENGAMSLAEKMPYDLNRAVTYTSDLAMRRGAQAVLVLPADLPFVTTADIGLMLYAGSDVVGAEARSNGADIGSVSEYNDTLDPEQPVMAICSDRRGCGTNALYLRPATDFDFHYGAGSLQRHIHEALARDYMVRLVNAPGLQFDLDTEPDWQAYQKDERSDHFEKSQIESLSS
jgi:2-phospho-L-lactate guanylyltransferase